MMTQEELNTELTRIEAMAAHANTAGLMGSIAVSLMRIANAQEAVYDLAVKDVNVAVEAAIEERAEAKAEELVKEQTSRSFIGKR